MKLPTPFPTGHEIDNRGHLVRVPRDSRGVRLRVGQHVAFNYSGNVATGRIEYIGAAIQIYRDSEFRSQYNASEVSRVRNRSSILVLEEA